MTPNAFELATKVEELSQAILVRHPTLPNLLQQIHRTLQQYPEQVTLMTEEQVNAVVEGLKIQTGVEFAKTATSGKASAATNLKRAIAAKGLDAF